MIKALLYKELYFPTAISVFCNPMYHIRKELCKQIRLNAPRLTGDLLDFGCGVKPYELLFKHCLSYTGVDYKATESAKNAKVDFFYDGKQLPFQNNRFDSVLCTEVLEHVFNIDELLVELHRVMKPGAIGLFTFPFAWPEHAQPYDFARYTSFSSRYIFEKNGYLIVSQSKTGTFLQVLSQLLLFYFATLLPTKNNWLASAILVPITSVLNILGIVFSFMPPKRDELYFNNIILVQKPAS